MNILHAAHSKAHGAKQAKGEKSLLNQLGKTGSPSPKSILELKQNPKYKDINFDHVLNAAKKGHDPEAMAKLLVEEKQTTKKENVLPFAKNNKVQGKHEANVQVDTLNPKLKTKTNPKIDMKVDAKTAPANLAQTEVSKNSIKGELLEAPRKSILDNPRITAHNEKALEAHTQSQAKLMTHQGSVPNKAAMAKPAVVGTIAKQAKTEAPRKSIFTTKKVLDIQKSSKFPQARAQMSRPMANAQLQAMAATSAQPGMKANLVSKSQGLQAAPVKMTNKKLVSQYKPQQNQMIKNQAAMVQNKSQAMVQNKSQAMVQNKSQAKVSEVDTLDVVSAKDNADMGEMMNRFQAPQTSQIEVATATAGAGKVLNMNQTQLAQNTDQVITQIQDYVVQAQASNQSEVSMSFEHQELGQVDLLVQKLDPRSAQLNIQIATRGNEAAEFFKTHQGELLNTLNRSGLQIADLKLDSASSQQGDLAQDSSRDQQFGKGQKDHNSQSGQRQSEQEKRRELWSQFNENKEAA